MFSKRIAFPLFTALLFLLTFQFGNAQETDRSAQTVIHLLSYVGMDYSGAVDNGKIINQQEFEEQVEFSGQAFALTKGGNFLKDKKGKVLEDISKLQELINQKASADDISSLVSLIKQEIIEVTGMPTVPASWPDINKGRVLYNQYCTTCHGDKGGGDGVLADGLDPRPVNFLDRAGMADVPPYQAFNTIRLGVPGTSMQGYKDLSDEEVWNLAFFVKSLALGNQPKDTAQLTKVFGEALGEVTLKDVANSTDDELLALLKQQDPNNAEQKFEALRILRSNDSRSGNSLPIARDNLKAALQNYSNGNKKQARALALEAYLEGIEPVEARLRADDPQFVLSLEKQMLAVRQAIEKDKGTEVLNQEVDKALKLINEADGRLGGQNLSFWFTFLLAGSIMLREGLEAFLVLAVVLALIRKTGVKKALPWLHGGWITAVIAGIIGWFFSGYIIQFGGKNREVMEGLVSLLAVAILLWAGFWLHNNSHGKKWSHFINDKIKGLLNRERMFGLAAFAFMVVFREAFEVIIFFQAISLEAAPGNQSAIGFGSLAALGIIAVMAYLFLKFSKRLPLQQIFRYSSWVIIILAVVLLGKGIHALQESGWIAVTDLSVPRIDWLGLYPTVQTVMAQVGILILILGGNYLNSQRQKKADLAVAKEQKNTPEKAEPSK